MDDLYLHDLHSDKTLWRDFSKFLTQKNINGKAIPWYIRRAQYFLSKTRNTRLSELTLESISFFDLPESYFAINPKLLI